MNSCRSSPSPRSYFGIDGILLVDHQIPMCYFSQVPAPQNSATNIQSNDFDVAIIGAGPAGLMAALTLAQSRQDCKVILLDKKDPWREPVACGEGVSKRGLGIFFNSIPETWIRGSVDGVLFVSPDGTKVRFSKPGIGLIINRAAMQDELAKKCATLGVACDFRARVHSVESSGLSGHTVRMEGATPRVFRARIVIDASGPGSRFGNALSNPDSVDLEPSTFALVRGIRFPSNYIQLFFGQSIAPGGYGWLFPRDSEVANVGVVVGRTLFKNVSSRKTLIDFINRFFPGSQIDLMHGGAIPCSGSDIPPMAVGGLFKAGDAASTVHPISRAGILEAMKSGSLAAKGALQALVAQTEAEREEIYRAYREGWLACYGRSHMRNRKAKPGFSTLPDKLLNRAAHRLAKSSDEDMPLSRIFLTTLWSSPGLLWRMKSLFSG